LTIKFYGPVVGFFFLCRKIAGRNFIAVTVIVKAFAAQAVPGTRGICARTVAGVDLGLGAFIDLCHKWKSFI